MMEAQCQEHMNREMAVFMSRRLGAAGSLPGPVAASGGSVVPLGPVLKTELRPLGPVVPVPAPRALGSSGGAVAPLEAFLTTRAVVPVCPPQVQVMGSTDGGPAVPVSAGEVTPFSRSEQQRLQQLRDSQRWAEQQQAILRVQALPFVPGADRPVGHIH